MDLKIPPTVVLLFALLLSVAFLFFPLTGSARLLPAFSGGVPKTAQGLSHTVRKPSRNSRAVFSPEVPVWEKEYRAVFY